jgi:hypothetical protein
MIPHQRDRLAVVTLERVFHDSSAVRASEIAAGGPAAEIKFFHFELFPPYL